ncbi:NADPH:quinone reductase [Ramlibacter henchirensis]|uniref:NADPH:quinone reductase n=1 Tax=Ramlibacter henchirensis TaxID=204072 RepID=A0A4Z0BW55_9BURK|nr:NADPH:quinone reductase [Ramlibacter henchirensis]TFZ02942.1 NADPH:quinone reductase [Ramlibacter henchirensis]
MKAAYYERTGPAGEVLQLGDMPDPVPSAGEVRVRVLWSGVNPSDVKSRMGFRSKDLPFPRVVPHSDGMGVIDSVGEGVHGGRVGERVWVWNAAWGRPFGTAAQFVVLPAEQAVPLAAGAPDEAGACLGIPALTAMHAVLVAGGVQGKTVLVQGGAGAVGHYAVQFAKQLGAAQVIATAGSEAKAQLARDAGADVLVNYKQEDLTARVLDATGGKGVDRIIEVDIGANGTVDPACMRDGADVVVYGSGQSRFSLDFFPLIARNIELRFFMVYILEREHRARAIKCLDKLLDKGTVRHNIAHRLPLAEIARAHDMVGDGSAGGNVVLRVGG